MRSPALKRRPPARPAEAPPERLAEAIAALDALGAALPAAAAAVLTELSAREEQPKRRALFPVERADALVAAKADELARTCARCAASVREAYRLLDEGELAHKLLAEDEPPTAALGLLCSARKSGRGVWLQLPAPLKAANLAELFATALIAPMAMPPPAYYVTSADVLVEQPASHEIDFRALGVSKAEQDELIKLQKLAETALNTVQDSVVLDLLEQHYRLQRESGVEPLSLGQLCAREPPGEF